MEPNDPNSNSTSNNAPNTPSNTASSPPPATPQPDALVPQSPAAPAAEAPVPFTPNIVVGGGDMEAPGGAAVPTAPVQPSSGKGRRKLRLTKPVIAGLVALVVLGGAAAFYFGYYTNPSVIYRQALKNTGKGYDRLVTYVDDQNKAGYKSAAGDGTFKLKIADFSTDGKLAVKGDENNSQLTFDVGTGTGRVDFDMRTIKSIGDTPDIYIKVGGLKGLGTTLGSPEVDPLLNKLDNTWVVVDHTLFDNYLAAYGADPTESAMKPPTREQVLDEASAFGKVNQDYVFSTDKDKAVLKVVKKVGKETVDGHKTYHYQVALDRDHVKDYIKAQKTALKDSKFYSWIKDNQGASGVDEMFDEMQQSANNIKESDTFDLWVDTKNHIIYKVRFSDDKSNAPQEYTDLGLDYKGGDNYPFFIAGQTKESGDGTTVINAVINVNTKSNDVNFTFKVKNDGPDAGTFDLGMKFKPGKSSVKVEKPAGAKPVAQLLTELGYPEIAQQLQELQSSAAGNGQGGVQSKAKDSKRQSDIKSLQTHLEAYYSEAGNYPSLAELNSSSWRKANMRGLDDNALQDPDSGSKTLAAASAPKVYAYQPTTSNGGSCESASTSCQKFTLTAMLSNGQKYAVQDLNS